MTPVGAANARGVEAPHVLHVDDEHGLVDLAATFLEREGLAVTTATDAETGLDRLEDNSIDAVVSDYDMPGTDGLEFLAAVREDYPDLPFILFTGKGSEEIASEAISRGVTDYLQKETGTDQYAVLANRIEESVRRYRAESELAETRRRHETLLANLPGMAYRATTEPGWPMSFVSEGCRAVTGYEAAQLTSGTVDWETDVIIPEDRVPARRTVETAVEQGEPFEVTYRITRKDGEERIVWEQGRAIDDGESADVTVLEGFITDVTARERNERALRTVSATQRAVLQQVTDGVFVVDLEAGEVLETNAAAADLTGYPEGELVGSDPKALLSAAETALADLTSAGEADLELPIARADGSPRRFTVSCSTLTFDEHRRLVLVLSPTE
ncbi:HTR-like protein [Salinarchaeum sp. Harcht-Bsk1]|uniref:PAS domain-containing response regulator n=1 Tax=Salinarchaeum sp. Harcht-Bsk1 TaxID=1333523 RepID=UPI0003424420|nr:response regulator [Salinarchaeum sp. Harcht-Bsk1]AGN00680.1 HTR-like protein [Salinarchaeum sp. Harcht-Bsk1]